jgi:hypothetical protein
MGNARSISDEPTNLGSLSEAAIVGSRLFAATAAMRALSVKKQSITQHENAIYALAAHGGERSVDLGGAACGYHVKLYCQGPGCVLHLIQVSGAIGGMQEHTHPRGLGQDVLEQLQLLGDEIRGDTRHLGNVSAWRARLATMPPSATPPKTNTIGIVRVALLAARYAGGRRCQDDVNRKTDKLGRKLWEPLSLISGPTIVDEDVLPLDVAVLAKLLPECLKNWPRARHGIDDADPVHLPGLLRFDGGHDAEYQRGTDA